MSEGRQRQCGECHKVFAQMRRPSRDLPSIESLSETVNPDVLRRRLWRRQDPRLHALFTHLRLEDGFPALKHRVINGGQGLSAQQEISVGSSAAEKLENWRKSVEDDGILRRPHVDPLGGRFS